MFIKYVLILGLVSVFILGGCTSTNQPLTSLDGALITDYDIDAAIFDLATSYKALVSKDLPKLAKPFAITALEDEPQGTFGTQAVLPDANGYIYAIKHTAKPVSWSIVSHNQKTDKQTTLYTGIREVQSVAGSPDGGTVVFSMKNGGYDLYIWQAGKVKRLTNNSVDDINVSLGHTSLLWEQRDNKKPNNTRMVTRELGKNQELSLATGTFTQPSISANGNWAVFVYNAGTSFYRLFRYDLVQNQLQQMYDSSSKVEHPSIDNSGTKMAFLSHIINPRPSSLVRLIDSTENTIELIASDSLIEHPFLTSDARYLSYSSGLSYQLKTKDLKTGQIINNGLGNYSFGATWSNLSLVDLTIEKTGSGAGNVSSASLVINCGWVCTASMPAYNQITLTAAPSSGSTFMGWEGCSTVNPDDSCSLSPTVDTTVTANFALPGSIDKRFGLNGSVTTDFFQEDDELNAMIIDRNGKILVGGSAQLGYRDYDFALARYNFDGSLDTSFGEGGKVTTHFETDDLNSQARIQALAINNNDKIIVAGRGRTSISLGMTNSRYVAMARYDSDGTLDRTFGDNGQVRINSIRVHYVNAMIISNSGKIVIAGITSRPLGSYRTWPGNFFLARYHSDGSPDTSFGENGIVTSTLPAGFHDAAYAIAIDDNHKVTIAGTLYESEIQSSSQFDLTERDYFLARYNEDGSLDTSFGSSGQVVLQFSGNQIFHDIKLDLNGKIIATGSGRVIRFNPNGSLDTSFGQNGISLIPTVNTSDDTPYNFFSYSDEHNLQIDTEGKIVIATVRGLARFNPDGSPDTNFSTNGFTNYGGIGDLDISALEIASNGSYIVARRSFSTPSTGLDFRITSYLP